MPINYHNFHFQNISFWRQICKFWIIWDTKTIYQKQKTVFRVFCKNARGNFRINEIYIAHWRNENTKSHDFEFLHNLHASDSIYYGSVATVIYTCRVKILFVKQLYFLKNPQFHGTFLQNKILFFHGNYIEGKITIV